MWILVDNFLHTQHPSEKMTKSQFFQLISRKKCSLSAFWSSPVTGAVMYWLRFISFGVLIDTAPYLQNNQTEIRKRDFRN
jgi:hypothetical protein